MSPSTSSVLHSLRLRSPASVEDVAGRAGLEVATTRSLLVTAEATGWVQHRDGRFSGWSLTIAGRRQGERWLAEELERTGRRGEVVGAYRRFRSLNPELLAICSEWQVTDQGDGGLVPNVHDDPERDAAVVDRLEALHDRATGVTTVLATILDRFDRYGPRLAVALDRVRAGDTDWLTRPAIDSYHTVWFELHEDLLATLGRTRSQEHDEDQLAPSSR